MRLGFPASYRAIQPAPDPSREGRLTEGLRTGSIPFQNVTSVSSLLPLRLSMCKVCAEGLKQVLDTLVSEEVGGVGRLERGEVGEHPDVRGKLVTELPYQRRNSMVRSVLHKGIGALDIEPRRLGIEKSAGVGLNARRRIPSLARAKNGSRRSM